MVSKKPLKTPTYKFFCEPCSFRCNNKKDFNRHLNTTKHKNGIHGVNGINHTEEENLKCDICDKIYKHKSGLYRHKKTCKNTPSVLSKIIQKLSILRKKQSKDLSVNVEKLTNFVRDCVNIRNIAHILHPMR